METTRRRFALDEALLGVEADLLHAVEAAQLGAGELDLAVLGLVKLARGVQTGLDLHGQVDLLGGRQQVDLADLLEVHAHGIAREHDGSGRLVAAAVRLAARLRRGCGDLGELDVDDGGLGGVDVALLDLLVELLGLVVGDVKARRLDVDALRADRVVDGVELVGIDVDVHQGELDVVLADRPFGPTLCHKLVDRRAELVRQCDLLHRLRQISSFRRRSNAPRTCFTCSKR